MDVFKCTAAADKTSSKNLWECSRKNFSFPTMEQRYLWGHWLLQIHASRKCARGDLGRSSIPLPQGKICQVWAIPGKSASTVTASAAPRLIYSSAHLSFLLGNVSNVWPKSSLLQFKPIISCLIPSGHEEQFITFLSATTFYIVEGCYHVSPSVFSSLD